jgi:hypothetical protein
MSGPSVRSLPLPGKVIAELKGHVGAVSSVRFNGVLRLVLGCLPCTTTLALVL